jgi:monoterpene epsilon-lactone hydrolase
MSWQSFLLNGALRLALKSQGNKPIDLNRVRANTAKPPRRALRIPEGISISEVAGDHGLRYDLIDQATPRTKAPETVILYLHGGGYFFGSPRTHRQAIIGVSRACGAPAYGLFYRLAPEHPFPAAVEDAAKAYDWVRARHPGARILLAGDSAGGGLSIVTALGARDAGLPMPVGLICYSPWTDLAVTGGSVDTNAKSCAMFTPNGVKRGAGLYLGGTDPREPKASPLYADLTGLPPLLLFASRHEILLDDTLRFADKAKRQGVDVELILRDRMPHVWPIFVHLLPEAREAMRDVARFARKVGVTTAAAPPVKA